MVTKGKKYSSEEFSYYPNLYMINGSAGYGFVLGPYLAKILKEYILNAKEIDKSLSPERFFTRWAKRLQRAYLVFKTVGAGLNSYIEKTEEFSFLKLILTTEIYFPILMFIFLIILSLIVKKKYFGNVN